MYLYFEEHFYLTGSNKISIKNTKVLEKMKQTLNYQGYMIIPDDDKINGISINKIWVDINKYTKYGNNITDINNIIKPYVRLMKIKKLMKVND
jgi:ribosomal protein S8